MQENHINTFEMIIDELKRFDPEKPWAMFGYLSGGCKETEKPLLPKYEKRIQALAKKCEGLKDEEVREFLSGLELSYLINL